MEKKIRTITVRNTQYVYWYYLGDECTQINLSPINDKTITVQIHFHNVTGTSHSDSAWFWELIKINALKDDMPVLIKLIQPGFIAELIELLQNDAPHLFLTRNKKTVYENGYKLLEKMGYSAIEPVWNSRLW